MPRKRKSKARNRNTQGQFISVSDNHDVFIVQQTGTSTSLNAYTQDTTSDVHDDVIDSSFLFVKERQDTTVVYNSHNLEKENPEKKHSMWYHCSTLQTANCLDISKLQKRGNFVSQTSPNGTCEKCFRQSTHNHPLTLTIEKVSVSSTGLYGAPLQKNSSVALCEHCKSYLMHRSMWKFAWPSVLCSLMFFEDKVNSNGQYFYSLLPLTLAQSWFTAAQVAGFFGVGNLPLFNDFDDILKNYNCVRGTTKAKTLKDTLNFLTFPFAKCPAGCSVQVSSYGSISFKHLLNKLFPLFTSFKSSKHILRGMRRDYLSAIIHLDQFLCSPCLTVNDDGLAIVTCPLHNTSIEKNFYHVPTSPFGNLMHSQADRFAILGTKLRYATPSKGGNYSNTFTTVTSQGGYGGISAVQLTNKRKFNVKSDKLLTQTEKLMVSSRRDIQNFLRRLSEMNEIDDVFESYISSPANSSHVLQCVIDDHLRGSTGSTLFAMLSIHTFLSGSNLSTPYIPPSLTICQIFDGHGAEPSMPNVSCYKKNKSFYIWSVWALNYEFLGHVLLNSVQTKNMYFKFLSNQFMKKRCETCRGLQLLFQSLQSPLPPLVPNSSPFSLLFQILELIPCFEMVLCPSRNSLPAITDDSPNINTGTNNIQCLVVFCAQQPSRSFCLPEVCCKYGKKFTLAFVLCENRETIYFRYGHFFHKWWQYRVDLSQFEKIDTFVDNFDSKIKSSWTLLLYFNNYTTLLNDLSTSPFFTTQNTFVCGVHQLPLSTDIRDTKYSCSFKGCNRRSRWRCPKDLCSSSCCLKHFKEFGQSENNVFLNPATESNRCSSETSKDDNDTDNASSISDNDELFFNGITETGLNLEPSLNTEATNEVHCLQDTSDNIPLHVLLNQTLQLFKRTRKPETLSKKYLRLFQNFAAANPGDIVSLLQVEALLCPSVFFNQNNDGSFNGALPYFLYNSEIYNDRYRFASLYDHVYARLTNLELPVAANIIYTHFLTDSLLNANLHSTVTTKFFKRGVQNISIEGRTLESSTSNNIKFSLIDSEKNVRELAAAMQVRLPVIFLTLTLNQRDHPGVAPLLRAIRLHFPNRASEEYKAAVQQYMPVILRMWNLTIQLLLEYLNNSDEIFLGKVTDIWGRAEFQTLVGNPPHYHLLLWIENFDPSQIDQIIVNTKKHLLHALEKLFHSDIGLIENSKEMWELYNQYCVIQTHSCETRDGHCSRKRGHDGKLVCRFPPYQPSNFSWLKEIPVHFSVRAYEILAKLGLAYSNDDYGFDIGPELACAKYSYPAAKNEHMMPNSVALFALTKSSGNVLFVTKNFSAKYLNKYAAGKEEHPEVLIKAAGTENTLQVSMGGITNTKISGVALSKSISNKSGRDVSGLNALHVAQTEFIWWALRLPSIHTTFDFIHVPSLALEHRGAALKSRSSIEIMNAQFICTIREEVGVSPDFLFTNNQKVIIEDNVFSKLTVDKVSKFSIRPPELLFIKKLNLYYSHFVQGKTLKNHRELRNALSSQPRPWIDGTNTIIRLRSGSVETMRSYVRNLVNSGSDCPKIVLFVSTLNSLSVESFQSVYISESPCYSVSPAVVVFSNVYPRDGLKFLLHLLYTMGEFETELDLFSSQSMRTCFVKAGLLPHGELNIDIAHALLRKYVLEQLVYMPGGNTSFSNRLIAAHSAITNLVLHDEVGLYELPCVLMSKLTALVELNVNNFIQTSQQRLFHCINPPNVSNKPASLPVNVHQYWMPKFKKAVTQTQESFEEQSKIIDWITQDLTAFITNSDTHSSKAHLIMGKPGSGKSHVCTICLLFALCNGLTCYATSLASRRASVFNCEHVHRLFCLGINPANDVATTVESALKKLEFKPERKALLMSLDVLVIEEVGLISGELMESMNLILQAIRGKTSYFGGVFIVANGDTNQLPNIDGTDFFLSTSLFFVYKCYFLQHFVRMMDPEGKQLLEMMSSKPVQDADILLIQTIISRRCSFVGTWDNVSDKTVMKVFGKKAAERDAVRCYQQKILNSGQRYVEFEAYDEMCSCHSSSWRMADEASIEFLNSNCREPKKLVFTDYCLLRLTINTDDLSQGQLCILSGIPNIDDSSIQVYVAPHVDAVNDPDLFVQMKFQFWPVKRISRTTGFTFARKDFTLRRTQFPVNNYVALTCHKLMGDTFAKIATQLSASDKNYCLWMASQLYVIISRVNELQNVVFVGPK